MSKITATIDSASDNELANLVRDLGRLDGRLAAELRQALRLELAHRTRAERT